MSQFRVTVIPLDIGLVAGTNSLGCFSNQGWRRGQEKGIN